MSLHSMTKSELRRAIAEERQEAGRQKEAALRQKVEEQNRKRKSAKMLVVKRTKTVKVRRNIPLSVRTKVLARDRNCVLCGRGPKHGATMHVDHIKPHSQGGSDSPSNLQTLCLECNLGKGARHSKSWRIT